MAEGFACNSQTLFADHGDGGVLIEDDDFLAAPVRLSFQQNRRISNAARHFSEVYTRSPPNRNLSVPARTNTDSVVTRKSLSRHGSKVHDSRRDKETVKELPGGFILSTLQSKETKRRYKELVEQSKKKLKEHEHLTTRHNMPKPTIIFSTALKQLETLQPILLTGVLGSGKTHLALDIMVTLLEGTDEYDPLILESPCDLEILENTPSPAVVLIDNCLGTNGVCHRYVSMLKKYQKLLQNLADRKRLILILTADNERTEQLLEHEVSFPINCRRLDLNSNEFLLNEREQKDILTSWLSKFKKHLLNKGKNIHLMDKPLPDEIGFPALCRLTGITTYPTVVEQPLDAIDEYITQLEQQFPSCYVILTLLATRGDVHNYIQLKHLESELEYLHEVLNLSDWSVTQLKDSLVDLRARGVVEELGKDKVVFASRLVANRMLKYFLDRYGTKYIRSLSVSAITRISFYETDTYDNYVNSLKVACELSSKVVKAVAANINTALESERSDVYLEIASLELWQKKNFLKTVFKVYGHHLFFISDKNHTTFLIYLIRTGQSKAVRDLLKHITTNPNIVLGVSGQLEEAKVEAVSCDDLDTLTLLLEICPEITPQLVWKVVECDNTVLLQSFSESFNLQSDPFVLRNACKHGCYNVLHYNTQTIKTKALSSEVRKRDRNGKTLLHYAASSGDLSVFSFIENLGADLKAKSSNGFTVAHVCAKYGHIDLLKYIHGRENKLIHQDADHGITCAHIAAMEGHDDVLIFLLESNVNPDVLSEDGFTISHIAAANGRNGVLRNMMAEHRKQMFMQSVNTLIPVHLAAKFGQTDTLKFFFTHGIDPDLTTVDSRTLVHIAAFECHLGTIEFFCSHYPLLCKLSDMDGNTVLHDAAAGGDLRVYLKLEENGGADPLKPNNDGATVLHDAAYYGRLSIVKHICSKHPEMVHSISRSGLTPAVGAALGGHVDIMEYLESQGADLKIPTKEGSTALHEAVYAGELQMVQHLCARFPYMKDARNNRSFTPLHFAAQEGHIDILRYLLSDRSGPLPVTEGDQTILHISTYNGMLATVKYICSKYPSLLQCRDAEGANAVHYAARGGSVETLEYLIDKGLDPKILTDSGSTILHLAAFDGNLDVVMHICERFPFLINNLDCSGHTAAHYAAGSGEIPVLLNILKFGVDPMVRAENGSTLLMKAAGSARVAMVQYLCSEYPDMLPLKDNFGCDMLHYAACGGSIDILKLGINNNLDPMTRSFEGHTLLHVATFHDRLQVVSFLCQFYPDMMNIKDATNKTPVDMAEEIGFINILSYYQESQTTPEPVRQTAELVHDTGDGLSDVLCCATGFKCSGCKRLWEAATGLVCFCRK